MKNYFNFGSNKTFKKLITSTTFYLPFFVSIARADLTTGDPTVDGQLQNIINIMFTIALAISVIKILQIGIMYLLAPTNKAKAKEAVFPWLVGAFICATFMTIGPMIINLFSQGNSGNPFGS